MKQLIAIALLFPAGTVLAADTDRRHGFWGDIDIGVGSLHLAPDVDGASTRTRLYLGLQGGYTMHPQVQLGIEFSGWNIEYSNLWEPAEGEGLSQVFAVTRIWPAASSNIFFKLGAGQVTHWNNAQGAESGSGSAYVVGLGYELFRYGSTETHWFLNYSIGNIADYTPPAGVAQDEDYTALTTGLSLGF